MTPEQEEQAVALWATRIRDTYQIAQALDVDEAVVFNALERIKARARLINSIRAA